MRTAGRSRWIRSGGGAFALVAVALVVVALVGGGGGGEAAVRAGAVATTEATPTSLALPPTTTASVVPTTAPSSTSTTLPEGGIQSEWDGNPKSLPDCIPVDAFGKTVGCVHKSDEFAPPGAAEDLRAKSGVPGVPVFDLANGDTLVGYLVDGPTGYVPLDFIDRVREIQGCVEMVMAEVSHESTTKLDSNCRALLVARGDDAAILDRF